MLASSVGGRFFRWGGLVAVGLALLLVFPAGVPRVAAATRADDVVAVRGSTWYVRGVSSGTPTVSFVYGRSGDVAVMGDWDGDGLATPGVVRGATWYLRNQRSSGAAQLTFRYGRVGDVPVVGDWDGDGVDTPGVVRGSTWYLRNANSAGDAQLSFGYGTRGDVPVAGDWNGDGVATVGVVRGNRWLLRGSLSAGPADADFRYGKAGDAPVVGDWDGNRSATAGVVRGTTWYLRNSHAGGVADQSFGFGACGDAPLSSTSARTTPGVPVSMRGGEWVKLPTSERVVALTFDAGANADGVASILSTLKSTGTPASFFATGGWVEAYPSLARQITASHPMGNHTQTHPDLTTLSDAAVRNELVQAHLAIRATTGVEPLPFFRFPFGARDARTIALTNCLNYGSVRWTVDTLGWQGTSGGQSVATVVDRVLRNLQPGEIVLLHVGSHPKDRSTLDAAALPRIISEVRARGYSFVNLDAYR